MANNITVPNRDSVSEFLARLDDAQQKQDSEKLIKIMGNVSGEQPVMWGSSIIGFGKLHYKYASGREGDWMRIGFSPRKGKLSLYITGDASSHLAALDAMGKYKIGKGCIYINRLSDVDIDRLTKLIEVTYANEESC